MRAQTPLPECAYLGSEVDLEQPRDASELRSYSDITGTYRYKIMFAIAITVLAVSVSL
jgi:hypothetical protein